MNSQNDYNAEWQKVTTFDQQGLPIPSYPRRKCST